MLLDPTKFRTEIDALPELLKSNDIFEPSAGQRIKQNILNSIQNLKAEPAINFFQRTKLKVREKGESVLRHMTAILIGLSLLGGSAFASSSAIPGGTLYPLKRIKERAQLVVTFSEVAKANLYAKFAGERLNELQKIEGDEDNKKVNLAEQRANIEVSNAIDALTSVQNKLIDKGNVRSAAVISANIEKLKAQAKILKVK